MIITIKNKKLAITTQIEAESFYLNPSEDLAFSINRGTMILSEMCDSKIFLTDVKIQLGKPKVPQIEIHYNSEEFEILVSLLKEAL